MHELTGLHHVTAITADASGNHAFYTQVLGMRLVKKTVNQDDVSAYHLFYADGMATPGTDLTFFVWPAPRERRGTSSIVRTGLRVAGEATLEWWRKRFDEKGITHSGIAERDGRLTLAFEDHEGQRLSLVDDGGAGDSHPWEKSAVPAEFQIRGLGPVTLSVADPVKLDRILTTGLHMRYSRSYAGEGGQALVYNMGQAGLAAQVHVREEPDLSAVGPGAGGVHHVAFRTPDSDYETWAQQLERVRVPSSGPIDRFYFRSLYFREPNGILFEIATDGPGFTADEPLATLGEKLSLPPFLEHRRDEIERSLKPL